MSSRAVYAAINAITGELAVVGIAKRRVNEVEGYHYRSIDDVLDQLAPLLAKYRLCVLPRVIERVVTERTDETQHLLIVVALRVAFNLTSVEDGSSHIVEVYGEALDGGDKATAKALSAAYKSAMVQTFCIPVCGTEDPDRSGHRLIAPTHQAEPLQGWQQWCADIIDIVSVCESGQAIATVQERNRELLKSLSREQPALYATLGEAFISRRERLRTRQTTAQPKSSRAKRSRRKVAPTERQLEHA